MKENPLAMKSGDKLPIVEIRYELELPGGITIAKYEALLHAFEERGRTMKKVAAWLRDRAWSRNASPQEFDALADELDPREPLAEADAAEKFSQQCAARKPK